MASPIRIALSYPATIAVIQLFPSAFTFSPTAKAAGMASQPIWAMDSVSPSSIARAWPIAPFTRPAFAAGTLKG